LYSNTYRQWVYVMVSVLLFGLVGVAGLAVVLGVFGDDDDFADDDPDDEEDSDGAAGPMKTTTGQVFIGDEGNDAAAGAAANC